MTDNPTPVQLKRHWGYGLLGVVLGLLMLGFGIGDFWFPEKHTAGGVLVLMGLVGLGLGAWAFTLRFVPPPPQPPIGRARYLAVLASGVLLGFSFPISFPFISHVEQLPSGIGDLCGFFGMVPLYWALQGQTPRRSMWLGFLSGMAFFNFTFWWVNVAMTTFGGIPWFFSIPVLQGLVAWCAFQWSLATLGAALLRDRRGWPLWAALPVTWASAEFMRNYFMTGYPWASMGYSTSRNLYFSQIAGLGGVYLIAFCMVWFNGNLFELWAYWKDRTRTLPKAALGAGLAMLVGGHVYGAYRVNKLDGEVAAARKVKVGLIQGNIDQKIKNRHDSYVHFIMSQYVPQTDLAVDEGAQLIVWPEAAFPGYFPPANERTGTIKVPGFDREKYVPMMFGAQTTSRRTGLSTNSAMLVNPDLTLEKQYDKHHLVPFGEYVLWDLDRYLPIGALVQDVGLFQPGKELPTWTVDMGGQPVNVGMLICYDAIFPEIVREYSTRDIDLFVNITNDAWYGFSSAPFQFLRMVAMRAVESGRSVARVANTGVTAVMDPAGRILEQTGLGLIPGNETVDEAMHVPAMRLVHEVALVRDPPIYAYVGDLFAWLCVILSLSGLLPARQGGVTQK